MIHQNPAAGLAAWVLFGITLSIGAACQRASEAEPKQPTGAAATTANTLAEPLGTSRAPLKLVSTLSLAECIELDGRTAKEERAFVEANNKCAKDFDCANVIHSRCEWSTAYAFMAASATAAYAALPSTSKLCKTYVEGRCSEYPQLVKPYASAVAPGSPKCKTGRCGATNY
jgi:hypothetical protein